MPSQPSPVPARRGIGRVRTGLALAGVLLVGVVAAVANSALIGGSSASVVGADRLGRVDGTAAMATGSTAALANRSDQVAASRSRPRTALLFCPNPSAALPLQSDPARGRASEMPPVLCPSPGADPATVKVLAKPHPYVPVPAPR